MLQEGGKVHGRELRFILLSLGGKHGVHQLGLQQESAKHSSAPGPESVAIFGYVLTSLS